MIVKNSLVSIRYPVPSTKEGGTVFLEAARADSRRDAEKSKAN